MQLERGISRGGERGKGRQKKFDIEGGWVGQYIPSVRYSIHAHVMFIR